MSRRDNPANSKCSHCGSEWFRLAEGENGEPPAVCVDTRGMVSAFAGTPVCMECETPWMHRRWEVIEGGKK